ncbi:Pentatricopeptide repeat-containing protein [Actinidia chinensis var. chinensis]|uniref:Pentatricopeptide repeat-containing protein n=1 Tax=Actinidia chinensis var. chinensis TaxID=1590841 RepID=A0A2R6P4M9_ACTCC|nr:Pentatricopeptide repeat-containing protein [Actinidia chinensis var. chinensis]
MEALSVRSVSSPLSLLGTPKPKRFGVRFQQQDSRNRALARKILRNWKQEGSVDRNTCMDCVALIRTSIRKNLPNVAKEIFLEMKSEGFLLDDSSLSALMLCYAYNGLFLEAQAIWDEILNSSFLPNIQIISELIDAYSRMGEFDEVIRILHQMNLRDSTLLPEIYAVALSCFGKRGQLERMEDTLREMISKGFVVDSVTGNAFLIYYSIFGSLTEMETAYGRLKRCRILIEKEGIRAMSFAYIKRKKFYRLGEFLRDVGLGRRNAGNLLWNLLLLSYAANFKMKSLQREFLRMVESGFNPDLTTFNIRALAFSKMSLFWDLHLSIEHMKHEKVVPDLVTYGCIVDAYLDKRLGMNLDFALSKLNVHTSPQVSTDPFVFEVLGKGDFHSSSESFLEFQRRKNWTYKELITTYLKKKYRSNQIFWNY